MNEDPRRLVGVLNGDRLSIKVCPSATGEAHSFTTVSVSPGEELVTVTLEAGRTYLRVDGVDAVFDGFRYFPRNPDDYDTVDYRGDVGDAMVDFAPADGSEYWADDLVDNIHAVTDTKVADLIDGIRAGRIEPMPEP